MIANIGFSQQMSVYTLGKCLFQGRHLQDKTLDEIGNDFLHDRVIQAIQSAKQCIERSGPTSCVYQADEEKLPMTWHIYAGCYIIFIKEFIKNVPLSQVYNI